MDGPIDSHARASPVTPLPARFASVRILGFKITPLTGADIVDLAEEAVTRRLRVALASQNLHGLYVHATDPRYAALHERPDVAVHVDGQPVLWLGRAAGHRWRQAVRAAWIDWFPAMIERARDRGWRVFYLGAEEEVLQRGLARFRARFPGLAIEGRNGFFDAAPMSAGSRAVVDAINAARPDLVFVGMGMPRQEAWVLAHRDHIEAPFVGMGGACIEYFAGAAATPPRWLGPAGLEWAYRLAGNPRRFAFRYLLEPVLLAGHLARRVRRRNQIHARR